MSGIIYCEYVRDHTMIKSFNIGYFNDSSITSSTSVQVIKAKKAILVKLNLLNNIRAIDVKLFNKNNGLQYLNDDDYIKTNTKITIKLKPTNSKRIKYYKKKVKIDEMILNMASSQNHNKWSKSCYPRTQKTNKMISCDDKERVCKWHNNLSLDLLPLSVIEDEIEHKSLSTNPDKIGSESQCNFIERTDINSRKVQIEYEQIKIIEMLQKRENLENEILENEKKRKNYWKYPSFKGYKGYKSYYNNYRGQKRRDFIDDMMNKYNPNKYVPHFSFIEYSSNNKTKDVIISNESCRVPALSLIKNRNKPKINPFQTISASKSKPINNDNKELSYLYVLYIYIY